MPHIKYKSNENSCSCELCVEMNQKYWSQVKKTTKIEIVVGAANIILTYVWLKSTAEIWIRVLLTEIIEL